MQVTHFNRHQSMNSETRSMILETINELCDCPLGHSTFTVENWLYGAFDGYDYSEIAKPSNELASIMQADPSLGFKILLIFDTIEKYPRTNQ